MKQCNWGRDVLLVEVPNDFWAFHIDEYGDIEAYPEDGGGGTKSIAWHFYKSDMPEGNWQFAFADPLNPTEQEAGGWVERQRGRGNFREYSMSGSSLNMYGDYYLNTAIESLHSRYRSEGFKNPDRVIQLIKKNTMKETYEQEAERLYPKLPVNTTEDTYNIYRREAHTKARQMSEQEIRELREENERLKAVIHQNYKSWHIQFYRATSDLTAREIDDMFKERYAKFKSENNL